MTEVSLPRLSTAARPVSPAGAATAPSPGIVHLGLGNFHRAHQAVYTNAALAQEGGDWGIIGVASRSEAVVSALHEQDMLYTVVEISPSGARLTVPRVHADAFVAAQDPERVRQAISARSTRIVSLTVTENGYTFSPATGALNLQDPMVQQDLAGQGPAHTPIGQIVRGLQERMRTHGDPLTVLSCDNLANNGHHTRRLVLEFASQIGGREAAELTAWVETQASFPSSMVDRIVPATTEHERQLVAEELGYVDRVPVPAEPFTMWVMEDDFIAGRPAWEAGGAVFSSEVAHYEQLKVRLLNGTHSLIAYLGALSGAVTIPDAVAHEYIETAAHRVLRQEYLPSVTVPATVDVDSYEEQLFSRWRNTALGHKTSQVGSDGSVKLRQRIPPPALELLASGAMPHHLALTTAAYLSCLAPLRGFDPGPQATAMQDRARPMLAALARQSHSGVQLARRVLTDRHLLGDQLAEQDDFIDRTGELIDVIQRHGPRAAALDAAGAANHHSKDVLRRAQ